MAGSVGFWFTLKRVEHLPAPRLEGGWDQQQSRVRRVLIYGVKSNIRFGSTLCFRSIQLHNAKEITPINGAAPTLKCGGDEGTNLSHSSGFRFKASVRNS